MKNKELKKKIVEIIINAIWKDAEADYDSTDETEAGLIADALVAAGIGDVREAKFEGDHYWRMWQGALVELERAEHRALVAERAFLILWNECKEKLGWDIDCTMWYKKRAEKELEEERKQAVKEFAEKLKETVTKYLYRTNFDGHKDFDIDFAELCRIIDEEVQQEAEKCGK